MDLPENGIKIMALRMPKHPTAREALRIWFYTKTAWFGRLMVKWRPYPDHAESRRGRLGYRWAMKTIKPRYAASTFGTLDSKGWLVLVGVSPEIQTHFLEMNGTLELWSAGKDGAYNTWVLPDTTTRCLYQIDDVLKVQLAGPAFR